jgi:hypothetical protein
MAAGMGVLRHPEHQLIERHTHRGGLLGDE